MLDQKYHFSRGLFAQKYVSESVQKKKLIILHVYEVKESESIWH